jgi:serine/threonine protein kinase
VPPSRCSSSALRIRSQLYDSFWIEVGEQRDVGHASAVQEGLDRLATLAVQPGTQNAFAALVEAAAAAGDLTFVAPELARGDALDGPALVFSLGGLMFYRLTGEHPFGSTGDAAWADHLRAGEIYTSVTAFLKVPPSLRAVLLRALARRREWRYPTLAAFRHALRESLRRASSSAVGLSPLLPGVIADEREQANRNRNAVRRKSRRTSLTSADDSTKRVRYTGSAARMRLSSSD